MQGGALTFRKRDELFHAAERALDRHKFNNIAQCFDAVMLMLEKDPANRFPTAASLVTALETGNVPELVPRAAPPPPAAGSTGGSTPNYPDPKPR